MLSLYSDRDGQMRPAHMYPYTHASVIGGCGGGRGGEIQELTNELTVELTIGLTNEHMLRNHLLYSVFGHRICFLNGFIMFSFILDSSKLKNTGVI